MEKGEKVIKAEVLLEVDNFLDNENDFNNIKKLINKIYDDFENKVCKNCEHQTKLICKKLQNLFGENFGCNRFERIEK